MNIKNTSKQILKKYCDQYAFMHCLESKLLETLCAMRQCVQNGGKILVCGNGGSCADADHIVGELMKSFKLHRPLNQTFQNDLEIWGEMGVTLSQKLEGSLPAINLSSHVSLMTAIINDIGSEYIFAQMVAGYGQAEDLLIGISTSGTSKNILLAGIAARAKGLKTVALTGRSGSMIEAIYEIVINAPAEATEDIQDMHSVVYHALCAMLENEFWGR